MAATISTTTSHADVKVKVVLIETQYVETDPQNFKSVVQRLTGKDCCVSWIEESSFSCRETETKNVGGGMIAAEGSYGTATIGSSYGGGGGGGGGGGFEDLDWLMLEATPLEELNWLWAELSS